MRYLLALLLMLPGIASAQMFSQLPPIPSVAPADYVPIVVPGSPSVDYRATIAQIFTQPTMVGPVTITGDGTISGNFGVGGTGNFIGTVGFSNGLVVSAGGATITGNLGVAGALGTTGNVTIGGNENITGTVTTGALISGPLSGTSLTTSGAIGGASFNVGGNSGATCGPSLPTSSFHVINGIVVSC